MLFNMSAIDYSHHSAHSTNLFCASTAMWVLEKVLGLRQPVGAPAHRGVAVEDGVTHGLINLDASLAECIKVAIIKYDTLTALSPDARREKYRETIPDMVRQALAKLRPYGVPSGVQGRVEWKPDGLRLPVIGYYDFEWSQHGIIVDLKTTEKLPFQIKVSHARQGAFYASSDNMAARLTYVTPKKCETYELENIREHREALRQIAVRIENFLVRFRTIRNSSNPSRLPTSRVSIGEVRRRVSSRSNIGECEANLEFPQQPGLAMPRAYRGFRRRIKRQCQFLAFQQRRPRAVTSHRSVNTTPAPVACS